MALIQNKKIINSFIISIFVVLFVQKIFDSSQILIKKWLLAQSGLEQFASFLTNYLTGDSQKNWRNYEF